MPVFIIASILVILDQVSKYWVLANLKDKTDLSFFGGLLRFTYLENRGAAFGMLQGRQTFFLIFTFAVLAFLLLFYWRHRHMGLIFNLAIGLIIGGAIGNLIDRIRLGFVVDFINVDLVSFYQFPIFNIADIGVSLGVALLAYLFIKLPEESWEGFFAGKNRK